MFGHAPHYIASLIGWCMRLFVLINIDPPPPLQMSKYNVCFFFGSHVNIIKNNISNWFI